MIYSSHLSSLFCFLILLVGCPAQPDDTSESTTHAAPSLDDPVMDSGVPDSATVEDSGVPESAGTDSGFSQVPSNMIDAGSIEMDSGTEEFIFMQVDSGNALNFTDGGIMSEAEDYLPLTPASCAAVCLARATNSQGSGGCEFSWNSGDCETRCMEMAPFSDQTQAAFSSCTLYDPLCYQTIEQCIWQERYPWPDLISLPTTFSGTGFQDYEGQTIKIVMQTVYNNYEYPPEQTITDGAFSVQWTAQTHPSTSNLLMYYIDVDGDGLCDTSIDYGGSLYGELTLDWDAPTLVVQEVFDDNNHTFVCDYID